MSNTTIRDQQSSSTHTHRDRMNNLALVPLRTPEPAEQVTIGAVYHMGGTWRAAIKTIDDLVLVARSRGEGFYLARDARLVASFRPDPDLAEEVRGVRTRRRPRRLAMSR